MAFCEKREADTVDEKVCDCPEKTNKKSSLAEISKLIADIRPANDASAEFDANDIEQNKAMAMLAYLGILVAVPFLFAKASKFARFHTNQGIILLIGEALYALVFGFIRSILLDMSWRMGFVINALGIFCFFFLALLILGIINAVNGKAKQLPLIGGFKILK